MEAAPGPVPRRKSIVVTMKKDVPHIDTISGKGL
jgi:hypothetical protein